MKIVAVIPAKLGAIRFPNKPLANICGVPMLGHIYARAVLSKEVDSVYVAAHDREILEYIQAKGGKGVMESNTQKNAVAGVWSALSEIEKDMGREVDWIIMIQGDEPMVNSETLDELADYVKSNPDLSAVNVVDILRDDREYYDPNIVKVILNTKGEGEWFFRIPSPRWKDGLKELRIMKQTGIIAFRKDFLSEFCAGEKTPMEKMESVDMFRLIENGKALPLILSKVPLYSVDTEGDREFVENMMKNDNLIDSYAERYKH